MSIEPIIEEIRCPHCNIGRLGKIVTQDLKNPENYLEALFVITIYIYLRCQEIVHQEFREFTM